MSGEPTYRSYLLRLWRTGRGAWRASLEDPHTGARRGFAGLPQLIAFLEQQLGAAPPADGPADGEGAPDTQGKARL
jgi:hypothetical protein